MTEKIVNSIIHLLFDPCAINIHDTNIAPVKNYDYIRLTDSLTVSMTGLPRSPLLATHEYVPASSRVRLLKLALPEVSSKVWFNGPRNVMFGEGFAARTVQENAALSVSLTVSGDIDTESRGGTVRQHRNLQENEDIQALPHSCY